MAAHPALDQVLRLQQFRRRHPEVDIQHRREPGWHWEACWRGPDGTTVLADYELAGLIDRLEAALDPGQQF
jgi:hypothetical protein